MSYQQMPVDQKAAVLQQRRTQYYARTHPQFAPTIYEPSNTLPLLSCTFDRHKFPTTAHDELLNQCPSIYEIGKRVIEQALNKTIPEGSQAAETCLPFTENGEIF